MGLDADTLQMLRRCQFVPCSIMHPGQGCKVHALGAFCRSAMAGLKMYGPFYLIQILISKRKELMEDPKGTLWKTIKSLVRSALFIGSLNFGGRISLCYVGKYFQMFGPLHYVICSAICTSSVYFDGPQRRMSVAKYLLPRSIEALWNMAKHAGYVVPLMNGEIWLFMASMGAMLMLFQTEPKFIDPSYFSLFRFLLKDN